MTHADEARRIAPPESYGTLCNEIAAALAASERAGWIAGRDAAADAEEKHHGCEPCGCDATPGAIARALLPAAVAKPAAKCGTCGSKGKVVDTVQATHVSGRGHENLITYKPCPACAVHDLKAEQFDDAALTAPLREEVERLREALRDIAAPRYGLDASDESQDHATYWSELALGYRRAAARALAEGDGNPSQKL